MTMYDFLLVTPGVMWYTTGEIRCGTVPEMRRNYKDSVFTCLFSDPRYMRELYLYLHPEDADVTEDEFQLVTTENVLAIGQYNDLGIQVRDKLILLVEAQSVFSPNIPLRLLMYLVATYKEYIAAHELSLYSTKAVAIPRRSCMWSIPGKRRMYRRRCACPICAVGRAAWRSM